MIPRTSAAALALALSALAEMPSPIPQARPSDRDQRSPENIFARQAKRQAKLARRAAKARRDAEATAAATQERVRLVPERGEVG